MLSNIEKDTKESYKYGPENESFILQLNILHGKKKYSVSLKDDKFRQEINKIKNDEVIFQQENAKFL